MESVVKNLIFLSHNVVIKAMYFDGGRIEIYEEDLDGQIHLATINNHISLWYNDFALKQIAFILYQTK